MGSGACCREYNHPIDYLASAFTVFTAPMFPKPFQISLARRMTPFSCVYASIADFTMRRTYRARLVRTLQVVLSYLLCTTTTLHPSRRLVVTRSHGCTTLLAIYPFVVLICLPPAIGTSSW